MTQNNPVAARIIERFRNRLSPFPGQDIMALIPHDRELRIDFHTYVDLYFGEIAGCASSADRLDRRSTAVLEKARNILAKSFFERYPRYVALQASITPERTPALLRQMQDMELNRQDLLLEVTRILATRTDSTI